MSAIRTWKQYDKATSSIGCEAKHVGRQGDTWYCGSECGECGRVEHCEKCNELKYEIELFEIKQLDEARAQSKRKKAGSK